MAVPKHPIQFSNSPRVRLANAPPPLFFARRGGAFILPAFAGQPFPCGQARGDGAPQGATISEQVEKNLVKKIVGVADFALSYNQWLKLDRARSQVEELFAMARHPQTDNEQYSDEEARQRFMTTLRAAVNTPPKPLKSMGPKGVQAQSKKRRKRSARAA